jgi:hypothetical protein
MRKGEIEKNILFHELKGNWDRIKDRETLIIRRMLYDNPKQVLEDYENEYLKKLFLRKIHLFDRINRNFWKIILKVSDKEINRATKKRSPYFLFPESGICKNFYEKKNIRQ